MNVFIHTSTNGVCMVDDLHPVIPNYPNGMTFGMYSVRFRADAVPGYKLVDLFWPADGISGEIDFPEDNNLGSTMTAFFHEIAGGPNTARFRTDTYSTGWNTATVQWTPTSIAFILNGTTIGTVTTPAEIPQTPMYLNFDTDGQMLGAPKPPATASGDLQIAWATVYTYAPVAPTLASVTPSVLGKGASTTIALTGQFMPTSTVTFNDPGITPLAAPTYVSSTELTVPVEVTTSATVGKVSVTVSDIAGVATCSGCLTIDPAPDIAGVSNPVVAGTTVPIIVTGSQFSKGLSVSTDLPGVILSSPTAVTTSRFAMTVTVPSRTPIGGYTLTVVNTNGGAASCEDCLQSVARPGAPTVGAVEPHNRRVTVSFSPPSDDGGSPIVSFSVTAIDTTDPTQGGQTASGSGSPITVRGLANGNTYRFAVTANNGYATSPFSAESEKTVPAERPRPPIVSATTAGNGRVAVSFHPQSDGGLPITSYRLTAINTADPADGGQTVTGHSSPLTVTGLTNGDAYTFTITATNARGTSAPSTPSSPAIPATVPTAPVITSVRGGHSQATVRFKPPNTDGGLPITSYSVTVVNATVPSDGGQTVNGYASPIKVTGLVDGDNYRFIVKATNAVGTGRGSESGKVALQVNV